MPDEPRNDRPQDREARDPGAYIGHEPERSSETIPGGVGPKDERVSAVATQPGAQAEAVPPSGHRQGDRVTDDDVREAGDHG